MPQDVHTQWNSTFYLLNFALEYCDAVDHITTDWPQKTQKTKTATSLKRHSKNPLKDLRNLKLSSHEWRLLEQLRNALKVCTLVSCHSAFSWVRF